MSKSLRSKQKRANRIVKRQKNSKKELVKLQKVVEQAKESSQSQESKKIYTVLGPITDEAATDKVETEMAVDGAEPSPPTEEALRTVAIDEMPMNTAPKKSTGDYPVWMNQRAIKRAKKAEKKKNSKIRKSRTAGRRPWRGH